MGRIRFIQKYCPQLENLEHVKRIKKTFHEDKTFTLTVLICLTNAIAQSELMALANEHGFAGVMKPRVDVVPKHAPCTRAQFDAWKVVWPMNFREDPRRLVNFHGWDFVTGNLWEVRFSEEEIVVIGAWMGDVLRLSRTAGSKGEYPIAALIIDPSTSTVLATSTDTRRTTHHPLRHAVMNCIDGVANRERLSKFSVPTTPSSATASVAPDVRNVPQKRKVREMEVDTIAVDREGERVSSASRPTMPTGADATERAYLCTGYDLYVSHEPCVMCAMALVHSRISRVFYALPTPGSGGLGSVYKIHSHSGLNHHYKVFRWLASIDNYMR
ncbi:cytidine deaminase-like protein [Jimgerdemannia flammicorona]|uniref:Cytidine deaminase-like protein n=1 Tax=Jimgerdemannia flammicorona TaxID=994334 RepID=A0A433D0F1_9FUNG|nr:cytidine deaminase-like protein [Jimgerdemannia flammicorona]